jgi:hypothetical protein
VERTALVRRWAAHKQLAKSCKGGTGVKGKRRCPEPTSLQEEHLLLCFFLKHKLLT